MVINRVVNSFSNAAKEYDSRAELQKNLANQLSKKIEKVAPTLPVGDVLEVGCGTGFLSEGILRIFEEDRCTLVDISPHLLNFCRKKCGEWGKLPHFLQCDGGMLHAPGRYSFIASSMTIQWFLDLENTLERWFDSLNEGGCCLFSFPHKIETSVGDSSLLINELPSIEKIKSWVDFKKYTLEFEQISSSEIFTDPMTWLKEMRLIGVNAPTHQKRPVFSIKKLLKEWGMGLNRDFTVTTSITIAMVRRKT